MFGGGLRKGKGIGKGDKTGHDTTIASLSRR